MNRFRFTIRDLLWLTAVVTMGVGWWLDHRHGATQRTSLSQIASYHETLDTLQNGLVVLLEEHPGHKTEIEQVKNRIKLFRDKITEVVTIP